MFTFAELIYLGCLSDYYGCRPPASRDEEPFLREFEEDGLGRDVQAVGSDRRTNYLAEDVLSMVEIGGLPAHILLIHGVVVLAPIAGILGILFTLVPRFRRGIAWPLGGLAVALVPLSLLTAEAGEQLESTMLESAAIEAHAEQGDLFKIIAILFFGVVAVQLATAFPQVWTRPKALKGLHGLLASRAVKVVAGVLGVVGGTFILYQAIVTGHSGSASVWGG